MRVQLLKSRFFPELRGPGPATPSPSSPQPRRVRPPVRRPRAGSGLRVVLGSRTGLPSGASPRDTRPDPRLQKPSGRGKGVGRRRAVAHHQRKERCHCCRVPLTTLSCSSYQQGNRHLLKSTMDEQKNIPERGCHRNCARRAAMHRENAPSKEERKEVILKLLFPSVLYRAPGYPSQSTSSYSTLRKSGIFSLSLSFPKEKLIAGVSLPCLLKSFQTLYCQLNYVSPSNSYVEIYQR
ncbi:uncharacterized protein LOC116662776 isoform X3 [Camelus ferus]|uniref:Uncharacterized protein LOC116662776 isoform X3 n=1 Tax=Camelus ferus TaxID=419612 RepID=A0A8B8STA1_CAMFR|nr:uncharacterized protein LOC116662776 isoform X3 [Camelus ferus]